MSDSSPVTQIAIAIVELKGAYLIGLREGSVPLAGKWEFPGGKVEQGETPALATARECLEETGLAVEVGELYLTHTHEYDHGRVELHFYRCWPRDAAALPRAPFRWVAREELGEYDFPAGNRELLVQLLGA